MTLAPLVDPSVHGVEGKPADLTEKCVVPGCLSFAQQRHHLWPRSYLRGQPVEWVHVQDVVMPNTVGICLRHHDWVTGGPGGHRAHIRWNLGLQLLEWWEKDSVCDEWYRVGALRNQALVNAEPEAAKHRKLEGLCPTCGKPQRKKPRGPKRPISMWAIGVPKDAEQGAEILDTFVEDLGVLMGLDPESPRLFRYHVLVPVLEWVSQNRAAFLADFLEE